MTVRETGLYYLQSRYYNPTWGRFLNADAYTSTGQGLLGNNMFAYCLNNPVNCYDPSGTAAFYTSTGDVNPFSPVYFGSGGGGISGCGGSGNSGYKDIIDELSDKTDKTLDAISAVAEDCWDAYVHSIELDAQQQYEQDIAMIDMATDIYECYQHVSDLSLVKFGKGSNKIYQGAKHIKTGVGCILVPVPTPAEDVYGMGEVVWGTVLVVAGITEVIICLEDQN